MMLVLTFEYVRTHSYLLIRCRRLVIDGEAFYHPLLLSPDIPKSVQTQKDL